MDNTFKTGIRNHIVTYWSVYRLVLVTVMIFIYIWLSKVIMQGEDLHIEAHNLSYYPMDSSFAD